MIYWRPVISGSTRLIFQPDGRYLIADYINGKNLPVHNKCKSDRVIAVKQQQSKIIAQFGYNHKTRELLHLNLPIPRFKCKT